MMKNMKADLVGRMRRMSRVSSEKYNMSQESPFQHFVWKKKYIRSLYSHMLIEDLCRHFSIEFSSFHIRRDFYKVQPIGDVLETFLKTKDWYDISHSFDEVLGQSMFSLILKGKAYIEVVLLKDDLDALESITFRSLIFTSAKTKKHITKLISHTSSGEKIKYNISNKYLIILDLRELGFSRNYFVGLIKKLAPLEVTKYTDLMLDKKSKFDFNEYKRKADFKLLYLTKDIHWMGRNYDNQYLSENYLLYRISMYKKMRWEFLDYMIKKFNEALDRFKDEYTFKGRIVVNTVPIDYEKHLADLSEGKINTTQMSDIVNAHK